MATIPKKVAERLVAGIKRYQPILASAKARDVGETDTVTIIKDMLADVFGYDKYSELTSEYAIRGTCLQASGATPIGAVRYARSLPRRIPAAWFRLTPFLGGRCYWPSRRLLLIQSGSLLASRTRNTITSSPETR